MQPLNTMSVRQENYRAIRRAVKTLGVATKKDVMQWTGLSFSTCNNLMNDLVESRQMLTLQEIRPGETGRPSLAYQLNAQYMLVLCVIIERRQAGSRLLLTVTDLYGQELKTAVHDRAEVDETAVFDAVREMTALYENIGMLGFSVPGIIAPDGTVLECDCGRLKGANLVQRSMEELGLCAICENDMNLMAYGMDEQDDCAETGSVAVVADYRDVPSGAGLVADGKILRGNTNFAGEISFLPAKELPHLERLAFQIACIAAVIDPALVAISGDQCRPGDLAQIVRALQKWIPPEHCPEIRMLEDRAGGCKGLVRLCLEKMENGEL